MSFVEFLKNVDGPLRFYLQYSLRKAGMDLENLREEEALRVIAKAAGGHVAEVFYAMYLESKQQSKLLALVSA